MKQTNDSFRDRALAEKLSARIREEAKSLGEVRLMHVCGTHEDTITRYGIRSLLPDNVSVYSGPGCPVCVTTAREIDEAIALSEKGIVLTSFGDMLKVPGSEKTLWEQKTEGGDVRIVYSITDAVDMARKNPDKDFVHIAVGFETTVPSTAAALQDAPENFSVLVCHRLIPPAMKFLLESGESKVDGFIDPGHVSAIIGLGPYREISEKHGIPQVVAGFEPLDVLYSILMLLKMIKERDHCVRNEYARIVRNEGNKKALEEMRKVFQACDMEWRGFPVIPASGLELRNKFIDRDARKRFDLNIKSKEDISGCQCGKVLRGLIHPHECGLFGKRCSPPNPVGPCMVSSEGACSIAYRYRKNA